MTSKNSYRRWPPADGRKFIHSDLFGKMLVGLVSELAKSYPNMDFTDAVANVFTWFDRKLSRNRRFINPRRFPTVASFVAYLRQAVWNAARLTERERRRDKRIEAPRDDRPIVIREMTPEERAELLEVVEALPEPHKTVFHRFFFDEEDLSVLASTYSLSEEQVRRVYEEAVDMLAEQMSS